MSRLLLLFVFIIIALAGGCMQSSIQISGTLIGHDGRPIKFAHVALYPSISAFWLPKEPPEPIQLISVKRDGSFRLSADTTGVFTLVFSGVNHAPKEVHLLLSNKCQDAEMNVQLGTYDHRSDFSEVAVIGDFNDFVENETSKPMQHQLDDTYVAEIKTEADTLSYQLVNLLQGKDRFHGMQSDRYLLKGRGHYTSVLDIENRIARIIFDPAQLVISDVKPTVIFRTETSEAARFAGFVKAVRDELHTYARRLEAMKGEEASEAELASFVNQYDWSHHHKALDQILNGENSPLFKQAATVLYLVEFRNFQALTFKYHEDAIGNFVQPWLTRKTFQILDTRSPLWSAWPDALRALSWANYISSIEDYELYIDRILDQHPDELFKAFMLYYEIVIAEYAQQKERSTSLYYRLVTEYPESKEAEFAQQAYRPDRTIQEGALVPTFKVTSLDSPNIVYSNERLKDLTYLVDFWGTWCGPCIRDMPYLHAAYDDYKELGFSILSLACDESSDKVNDFRSGKWKMPWLHGFLPDCYGSWKNDLLKTFEVAGFPTTVLIGPDQRILATGSDLRGEKLDETLSRIFSERPDLSNK